MGIFFAKLVQRLHHRAIQIAGSEFSTTILCNWRSSLGANLQITFVSYFDLFERFGIGEIEAVTKIDDCSQHRWLLDFAVFLTAFLFRPALSSIMTVLPKISPMSQLIPSVLAGFELFFKRDDLAGDTKVAPVVTDHQ